MPEETSVLPTLNACLNATATILLLAGYVAFRRRNYVAHGWIMGSAFFTSGVFLVSYLIYHYTAGHTTFPDLGWIRVAYLLMLASHIVLAVVVAPLAIAAVVLAARRKFAAHRRITRYLFPMWLYVSVTGVLIYMMLYHWFPAGV